MVGDERLSLDKRRNIVTPPTFSVYICDVIAAYLAILYLFVVIMMHATG